MTNCDKKQREAKLVAVPEGGLWHAEQLAAYLQVSLTWVWKQCREKRGLPFVDLGGRTYRFDPRAVEAWVKSRSQQGQVG